MGKRADQIGKQLSLKLTLPLTLLGRYSLQSAGQLEQLEIRFSSLVGTAEKAAALMVRLKSFAKATPFDLPDVANAAAGLLAAGVESKNLTDDLKVLGDIAAGAGTSLADMVPLYTELKIKGKAFTQDLRQFATRGIPIIAVLEKQLGKTGAQIFKMAEKSKITFPMIQKALISMTQEGGLFANQMERQSHSLFGIWGQFKDTVSFAAAELGKAGAKAVDLSGKLQALGKWIQELQIWFSALSPTQQKFIVWAGIALALLGPLLIIFGQIAMALTFLGGVLAAVTLAGSVLFFQFALGAIVLGDLIWQFSKLADMAGGIGNAFMVMGAAIVDFLIWPFQQVLQLVEKLWNKLGSAPAWLTKAAHFSLGEMAADSALAEQGTVTGARATFQKQNATAAAGANGKAQVEVTFKNAPAGTRASIVDNQNSNVTIDQGIAMQGGY
jgi:tape measure domain-containing protein